MTCSPSQIANLYAGGVDKLPLDEREKYVIDHMSDVVDSATNPLGGRKWWQEAEDPWQCLAACVELTKAMQSPSPEAYESRLPVQQVRHCSSRAAVGLSVAERAPATQDGSCNGLQHYAALARDQDGGRAVNLLPGEAPADVYRYVTASAPRQHIC